MTEVLEPKIKIRAPLRCEGIGSLDCAEDLDTGRRLAVRWLPLAAGGEDAARALQKLPRHPTLPEIRDTGRVGARAYVAIDFPEGHLLSAQLGDPVEPDELRALGAQVADALATIHAQGGVHGELSAESVLVVPPMRAILWDMPLVLANRLTNRRNEPSGLALSRMAPFLSPERAQGAEPTAAADVYALGALLCLAGWQKKPAAETSLEIIHKLASGAWSPVVPPVFQGPLRALLERTLDRDPRRRPSARQVAVRLAAGDAQASGVTELASAPAVPAPRVPPRAVTLIAALLVGAALALAGAVLLDKVRRATPSPGVPVPAPAAPALEGASAPKGELEASDEAARAPGRSAQLEKALEAARAPGRSAQLEKALEASDEAARAPSRSAQLEKALEANDEAARAPSRSAQLEKALEAARALGRSAQLEKALEAARALGRSAQLEKALKDVSEARSERSVRSVESEKVGSRAAKARAGTQGVPGSASAAKDDALSARARGGRAGRTGGEAVAVAEGNTGEGVALKTRSVRGSTSGLEPKSASDAGERRASQQPLPGRSSLVAGTDASAGLQVRTVEALSASELDLEPAALRPARPASQRPSRRRSPRRTSNVSRDLPAVSDELKRPAL